MAKRSAEQVRKTMQAIRSKNTKIEILLGKALWDKGYRYRKNNKKIIGSPDFTFQKYKLAVFCDSEFWHGKDWDKLSQRLNTNRDFWINKIERNMARDIKVNTLLREQGWTVLRFWEKEILKELDGCVDKIENIIKLQR